MRWKTTLILFISVIGLGAYISLHEIKQPLPQEKEQLAKQVLSIAPESVTQIALDLPQAKITLTRNQGVWRIASSKRRADPNRINQILNHTSLQAQRVLFANQEKPLDLKTYGLEPAIGWLSLVSDSTPITLQFGETTAVGQNRYVAISGRPEVYIVSSALFDEANQPTEKFQDPLFLRINTWEVDHLALATPAQNLSLMRREGQWRMTDPFEDVADNTQANEFLARLTGMSISHVVELNPQVEKLSEWGLDQPRLEVRLHLPESSEPITVFFGKHLSDAESLVFAKRSDEPALFAVSAKEVDSLIVDPKSLRSKNCFSGSLDQVRKIRLERPGGVLELERLETRWREASSSRELDLSKVNAFVQELLALRFQSFVEEPQADGTSYGLKPAVSAIEIVLQEPQRLEIGNSADEEQTRYGYLKHRKILARIPEQASLLAAKNVEELLILADPPSQEH